MKLSKTDTWVSVTLVSLIFLFSFLTYNHFNKRVERLSNSQAIGYVSYKYNVVKRKFSGRFIWENLRPQTPVYLRDSILTGEQSDAIVRLKSGVEIELDPNSLIQIDLIDDSLGLMLEKGVIRAKGNKDSSTLVETSSGLVADIRGSDVTFNQNKEGAGIFVKSGNVRIEGQNERVSSGKILTLGSDGKWSLRKVDIVDLKPTDGSLILSKTSSKKVTLKWNSKLNIREYELHLSQNSAMRNKKVIKVKGKSHTLTLKSSIWYWRLHARHNKKRVFSGLNSLNIQIFKPLEIITPENNTLLVSKPDDNIIFRWKLSREGSAVHFYLATDPEFKKIIKSDILVSSSVVLKGLKKGRYFWKVEPEIGKKKVANQTDKEDKDKAKHSFVVDDTQQALDIPKSLSPASNFSVAAGVNKKVRFSWDPVAGAITYHIQIFLDQNKQPVVNEKIDPNYYIFSLPWETQQIRWQVTALSISEQTKLLQKSKKSQASLSVSFRIPAPPKILSANSKLLY